MSTTCKVCGGTGKVPCTHCTGGWVQTRVGVFPNIRVLKTICLVCRGTQRQPCVICNGTGRVDAAPAMLATGAAAIRAKHVTEGGAYSGERCANMEVSDRRSR